ncbi:MAG: hypothetical protein ACC656_01620, partial [Candidatus Heimdallarchaeota archaeon]
MPEITALHLTIAYVLVVIASLYFIRRRMANKDYLFDLFLLGAFGWIITFFFETIPFRFFTNSSLYTIGIGINDPKYIHEVSSNWSILLIAPLIIGVIEELARYQTFRLYNSIDKLMFKYRFKTSLFLGMGWASAEILVLTSFALLEGYDYNITLFTVMMGVYARLMAYILQISLSFIVIFAVYEKSIKSRSLWLAILFNILINTIFSVWIFFFANLAMEHPSLYLFTQQLIVGIKVVSILIFTWKYLIPRSAPIME